MIDSLDILIMTWNSMPEFKCCLDSFDKAYPGDVIHRVIVVDKDSSDGTVDVARDWGCRVITDKGTLGSARLTGMRDSNQKWVNWVDSDIALDPNWFIDMRSSLYTFFGIDADSVGWFFGRTVDDFEPLRSEKLYKIELELGDGFRLLKLGDRPYTHNSICLRKPLLSADIGGLNSWEDFVLGQCMMKAGYRVVEFPVTCTHLRDSVYGKWGDLTEAWSISGELGVKGWNLRTLCKPFWFLWWGVRCSWHFSDISHLLYNSRVFASQVHALFKAKDFFVWSRDSS